ncbi:hypothetical protein FOG51_03634 [Hanseniaspora uvarum]|uniref:peptidyl-tRNA hydrolase n=1 Tax=Hanseniaspora uvarum TaxID=29833 RepID=A0A1E5RIY9_HANUV|nr:hypothetical protein FOG51_03634 [Hanseniaspora uvarum]KAF0278078.1 hypothetical protein FOG50_01065 [Hanseniaspora uvarum]KKA02857.1 Peptidyl-tRNA hydrolase 2 [Hanseniaspora uvarum DSM 2768]OEJ86845.1 Peptidyl-tRNA hydrolase 2 [Hanseniaspora uvarum]GMM39159.1 aminoacyl-tRNA hydrolase [Hanseniaspora uvarum]
MKNIGTLAATAVSCFILGVTYAKNWTSCEKIEPKQVINDDSDSDEESDMESVDEFMSDQYNQFSKLNDEVRLAICIRKDLKMTKGKTVAQSCHATLACFRSLSQSIQGMKIIDKWLYRGQAKITLQIENEDHLQELWMKAKELGVMACPIRDAGRTQVDPGTVTVIGIGPAPKSVLDQITGGLKLY